MPTEVLRYLGLKKEGATYAEDLAGEPDVHIDIASCSLDSPNEPFITYEGGIGRMPTRSIPGAYIPAGGLEFAAQVSTMAYILDLLLGVSAIDTTNEGTPSTTNPFTASGTTHDIDLTGPILQGSFKLDDAEVTPTQEAHDDGWGTIVEDNSSGVGGWIDYASGKIHLTGLTDTEDYNYEYNDGYYVHTITPVKGNVMPSFNAYCGKDIFEHKFLGCVLNQLDIAVEQELVNLALDIQAAKDVKKTMTALTALRLSSTKHGERQRSWADCTLQIGDAGGSLSDLSAKVRALSLSIVNNATTEENVGLGSRFPYDGTAGLLDITGSATLQFENADLKEDFWGSATGPTDTPQDKALQFKIDGGGITEGNWGDVVIDLPFMQLNAVNIQPSGREKLMQEIAFKLLYDTDTDKIIEATIKNYNRLHNPA